MQTLPTIREFFDDQYLTLKLANASPETWRTYRRTLRVVEAMCGEDPSLGMLTDDFVAGVQAFVIRGGYAPETANLHRRNLLAIWRYAWKRRLLAELPRDVPALPEPKHLRECWSAAEVGQLLDACRSVEGSVAGVPASVWWPALIMLVYDTGLRIGAVLSLKVRDFDEREGWVRATHRTQKHRADQVLKLHSDTVDALRAMLSTEERTPRRKRVRGTYATRAPGGVCVKRRPLEMLDTTLFAWPYTGDHLRREFKLILAAAGLSYRREDLFHKLRRTTATLLAAAAGEAAAQHQLGHSHISVTRRYFDERRLNRVHAADVLPRPVREERSTAD